MENTEEEPESLSEAAARLLAGLERRAKESEGQRAVSKALSPPLVDPEERQDAQERTIFMLRVIGLVMRHAQTNVLRFHANENRLPNLALEPFDEEEDIPW